MLFRDLIWEPYIQLISQIAIVQSVEKVYPLQTIGFGSLKRYPKKAGGVADPRTCCARFIQLPGFVIARRDYEAKQSPINYGGDCIPLTSLKTCESLASLFQSQGIKDLAMKFDLLSAGDQRQVGDGLN